MKKIKVKKPFGERHRLAEAASAVRTAKVLEDSAKWRAENEVVHERFMAAQAWWQKIQALRSGDPCEFHQAPEWVAASFVQPVSGSIPVHAWIVLDAQGQRLRVRYVRAPGDLEAWPGLQQPKPKSARMQRLEQKMDALRKRLSTKPPARELDVTPDLTSDADDLDLPKDNR